MRTVICLLALSLPLWAADEIDVLTLKGGRVVEGIYDPTTGNVEIMIGKMKGSLLVDKKDILKHEKKAAPKVVEKPKDEAPVDPAKRQAARQAALAGSLAADIAKNKEWKAAAERRSASMEQQQKLMPERIRSVESQLSDARRTLSNAEATAVSAAQNRDWYYNNNLRNNNNAAVTQAEVAKRRAAADVAKLEAERNKLVTEQSRIAQDLPQTVLRIAEFAQKITELEGKLAAQQAAPAAPTQPEGDLLGGTPKP